MEPMTKTLEGRTTVFTQYHNYQETRCSNFWISPMFSCPSAFFPKAVDHQTEKKWHKTLLWSVIHLTSIIISQEGRMPKIFVLNTWSLGEGGKKKQVGITLQLKIQSCSNDVTWNVLDGAQSWSLLRSWVPRWSGLPFSSPITPNNSNAGLFVQCFPWRSWCRDARNISYQDPWACQLWAWSSCLSAPWNHCCHSYAPYYMLRDSPGGKTAAGKRSCFWPGFQMGSPSLLRTWVQSGCCIMGFWETWLHYLSMLITFLTMLISRLAFVLM